MRSAPFTLALIAAVAQTTQATRCSPSDATPITDATPNVQQGRLLLTAVTGTRRSTTNVQRTVTGELTITDGCSFRLDSFSVQPPCSGSYWYGLAKGAAAATASGDDINDPYARPLRRVVSQEVNNYSGESVVFSLAGSAEDADATSAYAWRDMDALVLWCESEDRPIAEVAFIELEPSSGEGRAVGGMLTTAALALGGALLM